MAQAPALAARWASSSLVIPQILTRTIHHFLYFCADIRRTHKSFTDQYGMSPGFFCTRRISSCVLRPLSATMTIPLGILRDQLQAIIQINLKTLQIAVIDPNDLSSGRNALLTSASSCASTRQSNPKLCATFINSFNCLSVTSPRSTSTAEAP